MRDEIRELFPAYMKYVDAQPIANYIEKLLQEKKELEAEVLEANDNAAWWHSRYNAVNKQLDELKGESNETNKK